MTGTPLPVSLGAIQAHRSDQRSLHLDCGGPELAISVLTPRLLRIRLAPTGSFAPRRSWAVARDDAEFEAVPFSLEESPDQFLLRTEALELRIKRNPCTLSFADLNGRVFCADLAPAHWDAEPGPDGQRGSSLSKQIAEGEHFYGFGERAGWLERRGRVLTNWTTDPPTIGHFAGNDPMYIAIPIYMSLRPNLAYAVFLNNTYRSRFDIGEREAHTFRIETDGGELDYYLFFGPTPAEVLQAIGQLLGTTPLPPRWALGYHQSRWSYMSQDEVRSIAAEFRARQIPCDAIHLDIDYMRGYRVFTWDPLRFPEPAELMRDLARDGFRAVPIIDPGVKIDPRYEVYQQGIERGYFITRANGEVFESYVWPDDSVFSDYTRADVREWWGDLQAQLTAVGASGIWNDMNEPTVFARPFSQGGGQAGTIDLDAPQGAEHERTTHAEVHNLYGLGMAQASYEGLRRSLNGRRPFVLTRSAFAGIQRYSACWMGDNHSWWEHLELTLPQLMSMGLSGVPFVGTDIGGFFSNASGELFARWMQVGALMPFCRGHSAAGTRRQEPWTFGEQVEAICREALQLRYQLLPYLYSLFYTSMRIGAPVLRPLLYEFPNDQRCYHLHDQALLGAALLLAPIYQPGRESRAVYLPAGDWYDWWDGSHYQGEQHILALAPLERLPLYARGGAIIPMAPPMNYSSERALDQLTLEIFAGTGHLTLYEDDGESLAYEQGEFCTTQFNVREEAARVVFEASPREGRFVPPQRRVLLRLHTRDKTLKEATYDDDGSARSIVFDLITNN